VTLLCACGRPAKCVVDVSTRDEYQRSPMCHRCLGLASTLKGSTVDVVIDSIPESLSGLVCWCAQKGLRVAWCPTHGTLTNPVTSSETGDKECPRKIKRLRQRRAKG